jgi:hypothetical protein
MHLDAEMIHHEGAKNDSGIMWKSGNQDSLVHFFALLVAWWRISRGFCFFGW